MRILHMDAGREMRGGQWQALRLVEGLAAHGAEQTLLARAGGPLFDAGRRIGCRVEPFGVARAISMGRSYDVVHAHDARSHTLAALIGASRIVISRRVAFPIRSRWKYSRAQRYIAVSEFVKSVLMEGGVEESKIDVVYDGVPLLDQAEGDLVVAPANANDPEKGAPLAIEAARSAGVELTLSNSLESDLRRAAIFVYISHSEGLGSAALLAMSAGVPVIASRTGGLPEIIRDGQDGVLVENSVEAIAAAIRGLRKDPERAREMGRSGRAAVSERFTVEQMVRRTMDVYRQVLN